MALPRMYNFGDVIPAPTLHPLKKFRYNSLNLHFVPLSVDNQAILLRSPALFLNAGPAKYNGYLPIGTEDGLLKSTLTKLEEEVTRVLLAHSEECLNNLPKTLKEGFNRTPQLRPSCRGDRDVYFAKNAQDVQYYDWEGNPLPTAPGESGEYQLLFRIANIFFGNHGLDQHVASLHVRIAQVRYRPAEAERVSRHLPCCLLFDVPSESEHENIGEAAAAAAPIPTLVSNTHEEVVEVVAAEEQMMMETEQAPPQLPAATNNNKKEGAKRKRGGGLAAKSLSKAFTTLREQRNSAPAAWIVGENEGGTATPSNPSHEYNYFTLARK